MNFWNYVACLLLNIFEEAQNFGCRVAFRLYRKNGDVTTELLHDVPKICVNMNGIDFKLAFCVDCRVPTAVDLVREPLKWSRSLSGIL